MQRKTSIFKRVLAFALTICMVGSVVTPTISYAASSKETAPETEVVTEDSTVVDTSGETSSTEAPNDNTTHQTEDTPPTEVPVLPESTLIPEASPEPEEKTDEIPESNPTPLPETPQPESSPETTVKPEASEEPDVMPEPSTLPESTPDDGESEEPAEGEKVFEPITVLDPEKAISIAEIGDEVTLSAGINRDDVLVDYQWQRFQNPMPRDQVAQFEPLYDYSEGEPTWYRFPLADTTESELLAQNPEYTWPGVELFQAAKTALEKAGADTTNLTFVWKTPNYPLDGYLIDAAVVNGIPEIYAEKNEQRFVARKNESGVYAFSSTAEDVPLAPEATWQDIEGATEANYTFTVEEADLYANFRLKVIIRDEAYLTQVLEILESQGVTLTEEQKAEDQILYSIVMQVQSESMNEVEVDSAPVPMSEVFTTFAMNGAPTLSADGQWIENLNGNYEYITEDTYNRVKKWYDQIGGATAKLHFNACWTQLDASSYHQAPILNNEGIPSGKLRKYEGFILTDGHKLEVASEWYGKTVYFRPHGSDGIGTAIKIPAYTELSSNGDKYDEAQSGSRYKKAVTFLNAWVPDVGAIYKDYLNAASQQDGDGAGGFVHGTHITAYDVDAESFNADPARYMVDAEGNYRMDSVGWGVCMFEEPDLSGKSYWLLKDYIANGYGFLIGHDTLYAYAGAYHDAFGTDMDESTIDPNDGTTWYYDVNSWQPGTTAHTKDGQFSTTRGGHFYMNQLMGSNKGSVYSGTVSPSDAPSQILSTGGSHGPIGKEGMYQGNRLRIVKNLFNADLAAKNPRYRTPTNYPYSYAEGEVVDATYTHTNGQASFGPVWIEYADPSWFLIDESYGTQNWTPGTKPPADKWRPNVYEDPLTWSVDGMVGTNNFYLTGSGNFLMNQIGHIPTQNTAIHETRLFVNSVMYVSQRKQCEICAANQHGQQTSHFVRRVSAANWNEVITALQKGGNYWYPIDGCYQLTEDVALPEGWKPIKGFRGHWNSDVYEVKLASNYEPLLENRNADGPSGWNLGTDKNIGTENVFDSNMNRTTGVARIVGDLRTLFNTPKASYQDYTVKIFGTDNPKYFTGAQANKVFDCTVNSDSKYVISNMPCVYDSTTKQGTLRARVYDPTGKEVTEYGVIRVDVNKDFWDNDMTIPLYLDSISVSPVKDYTTYESAQTYFKAEAKSSEPLRFQQWEYSADDGQTWNAIPTEWNGEVKNTLYTPQDNGTDDFVIESFLTFNKTDPRWSNYNFRATFVSDEYGQFNTYRYYQKGSQFSNTNFDGAVEVKVAKGNANGHLDVKLWPAYAEQAPDQKVNEGDSTTFRAYGLALDDGTSISVKWQYSTPKTIVQGGTSPYDWHYINDDNEFGGLQEIVTDSPVSKIVSNADVELLQAAPDNNLDVFHKNAPFRGVESRLTVKKVDASQSGTYFRAEFTATTAFGTSYKWYSDIANESNGSWTSPSGTLGNFVKREVKDNSNKMTVIPPELRVESIPAKDFVDGSYNQCFMLDNEPYGQTLLLAKPDSTIADGTAAYQAIIYYRPENRIPTIEWEYRAANAIGAIGTWDEATAHSLGYPDVKVWVNNSAPEPTMYNGEAGWMSITSTMYISNVPSDMYVAEKSIAYQFRCTAHNSYDTVKRPHIEKYDDGHFGILTLDYKIQIQHNGVALANGKYEHGKNIVNGQTTTDVDGVKQATSGQAYSDWYYPNLKIKVPYGHYARTVVINIDDSVPHDSRDHILFNPHVEGTEYDISGWYGVQGKLSPDKKQLVLTQAQFMADSGREIPISTWETIIHERVGFRTYDKADFSANTTGGCQLQWYVDEALLSGVTIDAQSGHAYKVVDSSDIISWDTAKQQARYKDSDLKQGGYLAEINSAHEDELIHNLLGNNEAWIGGIERNGKWVWDSGAEMTYRNWANDAGWDKYVSMLGNGQWQTRPANMIVDQTLTFNNKAPWVKFYPYGRLDWNGGVQEENVELVEGHKYYVYVQYGDYGDANGAGFVRCDALGLNEAPNTQDAVHGWRTIVNDIYTSTETGTKKFIFNIDHRWCGPPSHNNGNGTFGTAMWNFNVIDLTEACGAGNEPSWSWCEANISKGWQSSYNIDYSIHQVTDIRKYVVEFELDPFHLKVTDHSAKDDGIIGTDVVVPTPIPPTEKVVAAKITGNSKIYDGLPIVPESFEVTGVQGASASLFNVTYQTKKLTDHSGYATRTVNGLDYQNTGAVNATVYHASIELTDEAVQAGWKLDKKHSTTECDLVIYPRPLDVHSYHNNKEYDRTANGTIQNIEFDSPTANSGIVNGDIVTLNTTQLNGYYLNHDGQTTIHNSTTNNNGQEYRMSVNSNDNLQIVHSSASDPHWNYVLRNKDFSGAILPRRVTVHSKYIEPEHPLSKPFDKRGRNIKKYDGTDEVILSDTGADNEMNIFISHESSMGEGIIKGDDIALDKTSYTGHYSAATADEKLDANGNPYNPRLLNLTEKVITLDANPQLVGNDYGDYEIVKYDFSGAIYRAELEAKAKTYRYIYGANFEGDHLPKKPTAVGDIGHPRPYDKRYEPGKPATNGSWISVDGLVNGDVLVLDNNFIFESFNKDDSVRTFDRTTPVGKYEVEMRGLNEQNYPVLENYLVTCSSGSVEVLAREIIITPADIDRSIEQGDEIPETYAKFRVMNDDGSTFSEIGDDKTMDYSEIMLTTKDSVADVILRNGNTLSKLPVDAAIMNVIGDETFFMNRSAIPFFTAWHPGAPVIYADINADPSTHECAWCENYYGTHSGTDHWMLNGYRLQVNQDSSKGETLSVKTVKNLNGEDVQNYIIRYEDAQLRVHPKQRFKLEATVPMFVCMYGYAATGEVITPTEYGIRNYSNGPIQIENINVSRDGWNVVEKPSKDMKAGEISMQLQGTHLHPGDNAPVPSEQWVVARDDTSNKIGVFMPIDVRAEIAGSNQNARQESYITHVTYTVGEYGLTLPDVPGANIPDMIDGKPVTKVPEQ